MPEIPEIASRATEMQNCLVGKTIHSIDILQPKSLNIPIEEFRDILTHARIESIGYHGKWIKVRTSSGWILVNLGMGGEILLVSRENMPPKYRFVIDFEDRSCLTINFWWFGYIHFCALESLHTHPMFSKLGPSILDLKEEDFFSLLKEQHGKIKSVLLNQSKVAGIGNAYIHDILFLAKLHPNRTIISLSDAEIHHLFQSIQEGLRPSLLKGGAFYELNLFGQKGGFRMEDILIGYRENAPCPICGSKILKIKTGPTSSFICSRCQGEP
ncbi:MAG: Fpg/Nei family DNA glycosylase [Chloroflexi bacterium]|nr:Fpg/Nei family DNA glycosylase [Chloroflexota bacterium]